MEEKAPGKSAMIIRQMSPEVFQADGPIVRVTREDIRALKACAARSPRRRARICAHPGPDDATHEMLIVLARHPLTYEYKA